MTRSKLSKTYNEHRPYVHSGNKRKHIDFCLKVVRKTKQNLFNITDVKSINEHKNFRKTIGPYFSNIGLNFNKIILLEKERLVKDPIAAAATTNNYFTNITRTMRRKGPQSNHETIVLHNFFISNSIFGFNVRVAQQIYVFKVKSCLGVA